MRLLLTAAAASLVIATSACNNTAKDTADANMADNMMMNNDTMMDNDMMMSNDSMMMSNETTTNAM